MSADFNTSILMLRTLDSWVTLDAVPEEELDVIQRLTYQDKRTNYLDYLFQTLQADGLLIDGI